MNNAKANLVVQKIMRQEDSKNKKRISKKKKGDFSKEYVTAKINQGLQKI